MILDILLVAFPLVFIPTIIIVASIIHSREKTEDSIQKMLEFNIRESVLYYLNRGEIPTIEDKNFIYNKYLYYLHHTEYQCTEIDDLIDRFLELPISKD